MAKLPSVMDLGQRPEAQPARGVVGYAVPTGGEGAIGAAMSQVGSQMSDVFGRIADQEQDRQNKIRAEDATNQLGQRMLDLAAGEDGFVHKKGADAATKPIFKDYLAQFDDAGRQLAQGLGNDAQRDAFNQRFNASRLQFQHQLLNHVTAENKVYQTKVDTDTVDIEVRKAGTDAFNPMVAETSWVRIEDTLNNRARREGWSAETLQDEKARAKDRVLESRLQAMRMVDPVKALETYQQNAGTMSPALRQKLGESLFKDAAPVLASDLVNSARVQQQQTAPGAPPLTLFGPPKVIAPAAKAYSPIIDKAAAANGIDPNLMLAQIQQESGGNLMAVSSAGARGVSQFIPGTAKRYGVDVTSAESSINGQARYMADLLKQFGGDYAKALGAYNMGEGNAKDQNGVTGLVMRHGDNWLANAPRETQNYVRAILGNVGVEYNKEPVTAGAAGGGAGGAQSVAPKTFIENAMRDPKAPTGHAVLDKLPLDQKITVMQAAATLANKDTSGLKEVMRDRLQDSQASALLNGYAPNPPTRDELVAAFGAHDGIRRYNTLQESIQTGQRIQGLKNMPDAQIQNLLETTRPEPGDGYAERAPLYDRVLQTANQVRQQRQADPVAYALHTGAYPIKPIQDFKDPAALTTELNARAASAVKIATDYGTPLSIMTKQEGAALSQLLKRAPVDQQKQYLGAIFSGVKDMNLYKSTMQALAPDNPVLASAGIDQAMQRRTTDGRDLADLVLSGNAILNPPPKEDGSPAGKNGLINLPDEKLMKSDFDSEVGNAFTGRPAARDLFEQRARAIYAKLIVEKGDYSGNLNSKLWKAAVQLSTGGVEKYNGSHVVLPYGMPPDKFKDGVLGRLDILAPSAVGAKADDLYGLPLENAGDGRYYVRRGTGYIIDKNSLPLVVDFNSVLPPKTEFTPPGVMNPKRFAETRGGAATGVRR